MHGAAFRFTQYIKANFTNFFVNKIVLDVGSGDINGNNRLLFNNCQYIGNDIYQGRNVDIVSKTSELPFNSNTFDTIVSTECFEHDAEYTKSFKKIIDMLKPGGLFFFTCASTGRPEHGTKRTTPQDSFGTIGNVEGWTDYYKNLTIEDIDIAINLSETFSQWCSYYKDHCCDLYFWGIKKGSSEKYSPGFFDEPYLIKTGSSES